MKPSLTRRIEQLELSMTGGDDQVVAVKAYWRGCSPDSWDDAPAVNDPVKSGYVVLNDDQWSRLVDAGGGA